MGSSPVRRYILVFLWWNECGFGRVCPPTVVITRTNKIGHVLPGIQFDSLANAIPSEFFDVIFPTHSEFLDSRRARIRDLHYSFITG
jgi:hypothetical protein